MRCHGVWRCHTSVSCMGTFTRVRRELCAERWPHWVGDSGLGRSGGSQFRSSQWIRLEHCQDKRSARTIPCVEESSGPGRKECKRRPHHRSKERRWANRIPRRSVSSGTEELLSAHRGCVGAGTEGNEYDGSACSLCAVRTPPGQTSTSVPYTGTDSFALIFSRNVILSINRGGGGWRAVPHTREVWVHMERTSRMVVIRFRAWLFFDSTNRSPQSPGHPQRNKHIGQ